MLNEFKFKGSIRITFIIHIIKALPLLFKFKFWILVDFNGSDQSKVLQKNIITYVQYNVVRNWKNQNKI